MAIEDRSGTDAASGSAYNSIKSMILDRRLLPGEKINQITMAKELTISRTPVVNALHRLESETSIAIVARNQIFI